MAVEKIGEDETKKLKVTCANCGSILQFYMLDVITKQSYYMGEHEGEVSYVICVECGNRVPVKPLTSK